MTSIERNESVSQKVRKTLQELKNEAEHSRQLHCEGINTRLSASIEGLFTNPLTAMLDVHKTSRFNLKKMVSQLTIGFLHTKHHLLIKAFQVDQQSKLIYYIVLKEDNTSNRDVFFEFLSILDDIGISEGLPVLIKFLPERVMDKVQLKDELVFN